MTTLHIQDIVRKKSVPSRYQPNSYRIFCEDIGNQSIPDEEKYSTQAPKLYTQPMILPAQAIEERNNPHAARAADFLRENAHTLNKPINRVKTKNFNNEIEKRWWEWSTTQEDPNWKKKSSSSLKEHRGSNSQLEPINGKEIGYQTTYQKEHGYPKDLIRTESGNLTRHGSNPNSNHAVGIVPITELSSFSKANENQRVFVDKVSFEQAYDSRNENNYPMKGRKHGAFVIEQEYPKPQLGIKARHDVNKGTSVWDAMHPNTDVIGNQPPKTHSHLKPPTGKPELLQNQRRDPIGYFEDTKFSENGEDRPIQNENSNAYIPSWNDQNLKANELLDNALRY